MQQDRFAWLLTHCYSPVASRSLAHMTIIYSPRCLDYGAPGHPENPERVRSTVALLHKEFHTWVTPEPCTEEDILRVHSPEQLRAVQRGTFSDADTPFFPEIFEIAKLSAGAAILTADRALTGLPAFSVMRPPGHHAERNRIMGFCYFNNIAIAVARLLKEGKAKRVAILDFDCHHGNGTEDIFRGDDRVLFVSLHQSPCYPGTGSITQGNSVNYPLPPGTGPQTFLAAFDKSLERIRDFRPDVLAVSAGFDAYKSDPITHMELEIDTFHEIGRRLADFTGFTSPGSPGLPCFAILEGGYSRDFGRCVDAFVTGWERR
jgi:acetoin utilization deacetylase AcuC-like enzyme